MKRVVSISIGSSKRDHYVETEIVGEKFSIERIGTDGNIPKAIDLIKQLDGKVDGMGMGGIDLYLWAGRKKYTIYQAVPIKKAAIKTPIVDGSGLKHTLEPQVIRYLWENRIIEFDSKKVLMTCALDRFGMAKAIAEQGGNLIIGDLLFALGLNIPIYSLSLLHRIATIVAPIACRLPFHMLYPTGGEQESYKENRTSGYYREAQIIAGDFHYIKRYVPSCLKGKTIITNTVTKDDVSLLKQKGAELLITTTPELQGRSFGTNVIEAVIVSILKSRNMTETPENYRMLLKEMDLKPRVEYLQKACGNSN